MPVSTMLPEGPPPRASIDTSKGNVCAIPFLPLDLGGFHIDGLDLQDISSASLEEDSRMHVRDRSASAPHTPAQAAAIPTRPAPTKQGSTPAVNAAGMYRLTVNGFRLSLQCDPIRGKVRGGIGTGGFGSYSQAFHMQSASTTAAQSSFIFFFVLAMNLANLLSQFRCHAYSASTADYCAAASRHASASATASAHYAGKCILYKYMS